MSEPAISFDGDTLVIRDIPTALAVVNYGIRESRDPRERGGLLNFATLFARTQHGLSGAAWGPPNAPLDVVEGWAVATMLQTGADEAYLAAVGAYAGLAGPAERDACAGMLWDRNDALLRPDAALVTAVLESDNPMSYLVGAMKKRALAERIVEPQERMGPLSLRTSGASLAVEGTPGIDVAEYLAALRASGKARDLRLASDVEQWLNGVPKREMGDAAYQRVLHHFEQPRARAVARRAGATMPRAAGCGVMASPPWFYSRSGRKDSVWHQANARLLGG